MTEDEMVGWHHRLDGHTFEQAPRVGDGQGGLVCYSPWGCEESDTTQRLSLHTAPANTSEPNVNHESAETPISPISLMSIFG